MHLRKIQRNTVTKVILASEVKPGLSNVQLRVPFRALSLTLFFCFIWHIPNQLAKECC